MNSDKHILVVDDEPHILQILHFLLTDEGYQVTTVETGEAAVETADSEDFDLVVLDLALPGIDGFSVCRTLRDKGIPILILSSHDEDDYVVSGLELGALDYVRKPFNHRELILRVANLIGRNDGEERPQGIVSEGVSVNLDSEEVLCRGERVRLTPTEYLLLVLLMKQKGAVVTWEEILREVWGTEEWDGYRQMIKVNIQRLRTKVEQDPHNPRIIVNQWGRGYRFALPVTIS
ncbi:response regulator transcription factor [Sediminispirochaeta smaragdinae]|jgi:DNA-binding response OmpR family regulator|uniref:Two component transcriptional regulator, winged helix family n=1 Tax=Sediminispirochaeta smaragdinae (strain DSM 11293 / JCM 15392 / SEBR 4228) TaxID=573413 RepID=E1R971_SEDSS|nr:response regulator transcription factor [Sediminispirochaeta smaragdinae]ADK83040.1 two component transcriptional regulator, winged helix family [Sediminispirochaeta smaragdinae DSM 11293]